MYRLDVLVLALLLVSSDSFLLPLRSSAKSVRVRMAPPGDGPAGSFFHPVPDDDDEDNNDAPAAGIDEAINDLIKQQKSPPRASRPSTIDGVPTADAGTGVSSSLQSSTTRSSCNQ
jgi:hypothetical protein